MATDWMKLFETVAPIAQSTVGGFLGAKQQNAQNALSKEQLDYQRGVDDRNFKQEQAMVGLNATQMNPFTQQQYRGKAALTGALMGNFAPTTYDSATRNYSGGINIPGLMDSLKGYYTPDAMAAAEQTFTKNVQNASPMYQGGPTAVSGYGSDVMSRLQAQMPGAQSTQGAATAAPVAPDLAAKLAAFQGAKGGGGFLSGAMAGAGMGNMLGSVVPGLGNAVGTIGGALAGGLKNAFSGGEGAQVNKVRDQFKGLFGDTQGHALGDLAQSLPGAQGAYNQFMTAGKAGDLNNAIAQLTALLTGKA